MGPMTFVLPNTRLIACSKHSCMMSCLNINGQVQMVGSGPLKDPQVF